MLRPIILLAAFLVAFSAPIGADTADSPAFGSFGLDLSTEDTSVKPGDDFHRYVEGHWLESAKIPSDRTRWGVFDELAVKAESDVHGILEDAAGKVARREAAAGSNEQKIGDFYTAFLDTGRIDDRGMKPAQPGLEAIERAKTHDQVAALIAKPESGLDGPVGFYIALDQKNPDRYILRISQSGLSLPDRDYYLKTDPQFADIRQKFVTHAGRMLALAGHTEARAKSEAAQILSLETEIAKLHWERAKRRERELTYNLMTVQSLERDAPAYPWAAAFRSAGLALPPGPSAQHEGNAPVLREVVVAEWSAVPELAKLFRSTPVGTWKSYLTYHYVSASASVLPKAFDDEDFDFYGRILNGQPEQRLRWKRAVQAVNAALGEAVGELYVAKHFPPESKAAMEALVGNLRKAYAEHIANEPWMTPETRQVALEKLEAFRSKIGYPVKWRDYSKLTIKPGDAFGNHERAEVFEWNRQLARLDKPTDRDEWGMTPQTVNAYYNPTFNEIVFPAAILQPPFFDSKADPAVNYGAIGGVIGHEMGHGFDDQGSKSDAKGILRTWWKPEDIDAFKQRTGALADQYAQFEPLPGLHLNGRLTLGENIGDLGGLTMAHDAYRMSLNGAMPPVIEGLSADQRFFLSWAQVWRELIRPEALRNRILTDPHSPAEYRVNGVVRNVDAWYSAFEVKPGDKLYLAPEQRVRIW
jgi:predicted metalloendopeptidase